MAAAALLIAAAVGCGSESKTPSTAPHARSDGGEPPGSVPAGDGRGRIDLEKIGDFESPVYVTQPPAGDEHLYVVEQNGRVLRLSPGGGEAPETFLDISDRVSTGGEQGLLSIAFDPDFARSGLVYVDYTDPGNDVQVAEYQAGTGKVADPASARPVLSIDHPYTNHNGGQLQFGPDGLLYIGVGDGGAEEDPDRVGQDLASPLAKILRIDPRAHAGKPYGIPADNPFAGQSGARPETYAYGLRNPWRFSFDRKTGDLWIGDVGQNEFEEIDGVRRGQGSGANFGWSAYEANARFNSDQQAPHAVGPVLAYSHDDGCSVTGGYVVRDPQLPSLYGRYVYGDYCTGQLRSFTAKPGVRARDDRPVGVEVPSLSSFGEDAEGHLFASSLGGALYRVVESR